jgi:hypothetical protein
MDRRASDGVVTDASGSTSTTPLLDFQSPAIQQLVAALVQDNPRRMLQEAHRRIAEQVRPVYALGELQPASKTLARRRGSCSQRLAVLEAVARALGVATRVRGLLVDGAFWYPRFPRLKFAVPDVVVLAWPEFLLNGVWANSSELFGAVGSRVGFRGFSNAEGETLFDAIARTAVDWDGVTSTAGSRSACDLSAEVLRDLGRFDSRDELFAAHGQTLCWGVRTLAGPIAGRWSAGVSA